MARMKNVERLRRAGLIAAPEDRELDPALEARLNRLSREELEAILAVKQKLRLRIDLGGSGDPLGPFSCGF